MKQYCKQSPAFENFSMWKERKLRKNAKKCYKRSSMLQNKSYKIILNEMEIDFYCYCRDNIFK